MIRLLPSEVADAIAAGEVVERPASVVKELVENALDAGARAITVEVRGAGRTLIRVTDDGVGIPAGQLELAFRRHATSKVRNLADLEAIGSLGFRGEALASVAAVAEVESSSSGRRIRLRAGQVLEESAAPLVRGAVFEVRDLFANTPARLRFLKTEATEQSAIARTVGAYALCYPEVRFRLLAEGRTAISSPGDADLRRAIAAVHGRAVAAEMVAVRWANSELGIVAAGMVSEPRLSRGSREGMLLAVNRRPIASRALGYALEECYRGRLERGRYPMAMLGVELAPAEVDVNVHPAKREVRFREEGAVFAAVQRAVREALAESQPYSLPLGRATAAAQPQVAFNRLDLREPQAQMTTLPVEAAPTAMRPLGQVQEGYLVAEGDDGLVLIDQHAAHERVLFNLFLARLEGAQVTAQPLLLPALMDVDPGQMAAASDHRAQLERLGFDFEEFGPNTLRLLAAPAETPAGRAEGALSELLGILCEGRREDRSRDAVASLACHSAVRFGDHLDPAQQRRLLVQLESAAESITCPHGRPTRLLLSWQDLKRHFRRNY